MYQDALARFASAQTTTTSVAHTDIIDTLAAGNDYDGNWFVFQVSTTFTAGGTTALPTLMVQLQTSDVSTFDSSNTNTLVVSADFPVANLTVGKFYAVKIPPGARRYIRAYNKVTSAAQSFFSAGAWNSFITTDVDVTLSGRYLLRG